MPSRMMCDPGHGGVGLQTLRDWIPRFNAKGSAGLVDTKAPGQLFKLDGQQRQQFLQLVGEGPAAAIHGVVRWCLINLAQRLFEEHGLSTAKQTLNREMRTLRLRKVSARPQHHVQDPEPAEVFRETSPLVWQKLPGQGRQTPR
ncbi:transposase [Pseudoroseomonas globiformis]|uniref:Transposase n=1 Tax=Teichococcus globiformis TaxID=2307229 RepID=A0ABV7FYW4_9PROT